MELTALNLLPQSEIAMSGNTTKLAALLEVGGLVAAILLAFEGFLRALGSVWWSNTEFSYGALVPLLIGYLIWKRWPTLQKIEKTTWRPAIAGVIAGCGLQVLASFSGTLVLSALALTLTLISSVAFLWGRKITQVLWLPLSLTVLMAPVPTYLADDITWRLQIVASAASSALLRLLHIPVYQDGNLLVLSNYVLEVKEACSGSRSFFALAGLALVLSLTTEKKLWVRIALICAAPFLSISANLVRIVGTGIVAQRWGNLAANESLHWAWGMMVFLIAVFGLFGLHKLLRWASNENTLQY